MLFSLSFRSVRLISVYCLNLVTSVLSCNTVYTYIAVCKYLFVFIHILSLCVYIFHILGLCTLWRTNTFPTTEFCLPAAFCADPKRPLTRLPFEPKRPLTRVSTITP